MTIRTLLSLLIFTIGIFVTAKEIKDIEPNNSVETAQAVAVDDSIILKLSKKGDRDYFKIKSPGEGVIRVKQIKESKTHGWIYPFWFRAESKEVERDGIWDIKVKKGESIYLAIRSDQHAWKEKAGDEEVKLTVHFEVFTQPEPDNEFKTARKIELGKVFKLQMNPRFDRDYITFVSPGNGTVLLKQSKESTTHGWLYPLWMISEKQEIRHGEWSSKVKKDQKIVIALRSALHSWKELSSAEEIELQADFHAEIAVSEPNDSYKSAEKITAGQTIKLTINPRLDRDYYTLTAPGDGVIKLTQLAKSKAHEWLYPWWMIDDKKFTRSGEWTYQCKKGEKIVFGLRSALHNWKEVASPEVIKVKVTFEKDLFGNEPNDSVANAVKLELGKPFSLQLSPRLDRDYYTVTAPGNGVIKLKQLAVSKAHEWLYPWWMIDDKKFTRSGEWDYTVKKGQTVVFGLRSDLHTWKEVQSSEIIKMMISFEKELIGNEPNDSVADAVKLELGKPFSLQLSPRLDRDYYTVTAPDNGVIKLKQLAVSKAHEWLYPWWMIDDKKFTRSGEWDYTVKKGQTVVFGLRSDLHTWKEVQSSEIIKMMISFEKELIGNEPNDSFQTAQRVELGKPFKLQLNPRLDRDYFKLKAPGSGTIKLTQLGESKTHGFLYPTWMLNARKTFRGGLWDRSVKAGETVVFELRSDPYSWKEKSSDESISMLLTFSPEDAGAEPNNSMQEAKLVELDKAFDFQLNPKGDQDYFKMKMRKGGILSLSRIDKEKVHSDLLVWWGENEDDEKQSVNIWEKRVQVDEMVYVAMRSAQYSWKDVGSDIPLKFILKHLPEADKSEPNDHPDDAVTVAVGKAFTYVMQPVNDRDYFLLTAPGDGVLMVRQTDKNQLPFYTEWRKAGDSKVSKGAWIHVDKGEKYLLAIQSSGYGHAKADKHQAIVEFGSEKDFNLVKPIARKSWSFNIKLKEDEPENEE